MKNTLCFLSLLLASGSTWCAEIDFQGVTTLLDDGMSKVIEQETLPAERFMGRDRQDAAQEFQAIIDESLNMLLSEEFLKHRASYRKLEKLIVQEKALLAEKIEKRTFAPAADASLPAKMLPSETLKSMVASTKGDYDLLIEAHQKNIEAYEQDLLLVRSKISTFLEELGVGVEQEQLDFLLSSRTGEDLIAMSVAFEHIKALTLQLGELTSQSGENIGYAKRYYGMFVVLHKLLLAMQDRFITEANTQILVDLAAYRSEAEDLIAATRSMQKDNPDNESLIANLKANRLTLQAIDSYETFVIEHRDRAIRARQIIARQEEIARNTYDTVSLSSNVSGLIRNGFNVFNSLADIQIPSVMPFENQDLEREFKRINVRLNEGMNY